MLRNKLTCVFVDNGLLRMNERENVKNLYKKYFNLDLRVANKSTLFLSRLKGISDPEKKRKIIGNTFVEVFDEAVNRLKKSGDYSFLAQGTLIQM